MPPGGNVPYGYCRRAKQLVREPAETQIVLSVFELAERGETPSAIARILSANGFTRRNGKAWTQRQVAAILANLPFYAEGVLRYGEVKALDRNLVIVNKRSGL